MIELNRKLYMDEETGEKNEQFDGLKEKLSAIFGDNIFKSRRFEIQ